MSTDDFDVLVVGGGPGGYIAAIRAAQLGLRTALAERGELGGVCLNWGCIPTKALLRSADVLRLVRTAGHYGVQAQAPAADLPAMVARSRAIAGQLQRGVAYLMKKNGVQVLHAQARLTGGTGVALTSVAGKPTPGRLTARHIILATGARARVLPGLEPDAARTWYYREALAAPFLPRRLLVIGAGAIGVEFASFFHALGSQVHIVEMAARLLPAEDEEVSGCMAEALRQQGMQLHLGCRVTRTERTRAGWQVWLQGGSTAVDVDVILVAAGIVGNHQDLGLEHTAVQVAHDHVVVDDYCATHEPGIYAIGDLAGPPWLAHKASHEAVICVESIAGLNPEPLQAQKIPACTYSYPQVAHVGLTETQARTRGSAVRVGRFPFAANGKAIASGETQGFVKVVLDEASGELLGAHMMGAEVTEMIQGFTVAMGLEATETDLIQSVFPHPTQSEAMAEAVLAAYGRGLNR
ncbi:dihydrolipoyl dehydrogenase [Castellaniella sp.]|uniref:dihydrolipoyl dehydrogenase n=1 Tax=Castellaniella sp. TaxID=1955812 RepID=UPI0035649CDC